MPGPACATWRARDLPVLLIMKVTMNVLESKQYQDALKLVKKFHAGQTRASNVPVWHHLARVSRQLEFVLHKTLEGTERERDIIVIASLAHDSLEDTKVTKAELEKVLGKDGLAIVEGMTNTWGDDHPKEYVEKVAGSSEAVRLVKMSDMIENITSVALNLKILGLKFADEYFSPIIEPMYEALINTKFTTFPETAERMMFLMKWAKQLYDSELSFCREDEKTQ